MKHKQKRRTYLKTAIGRVAVRGPHRACGDDLILVAHPDSPVRYKGRAYALVVFLRRKFDRWTVAKDSVVVRAETMKRAPAKLTDRIIKILLLALTRRESSKPR